MGQEKFFKFSRMGTDEKGMYKARQDQVQKHE